MKQKLLWPRLTDASYAASRSALVCFEETQAFADLHRLVRAELLLDCALLWPGWWRLEFVALRHSAQFRLYKGTRLMGMMTAKQVAEQKRWLAAYVLAAYGLTAGAAWVVPARTAFEAYEYGKHELKAG